MFRLCHPPVQRPASSRVQCAVVLSLLLSIATPARAAVDSHSYAEPDRYRQTKLALSLDVDFAAKQLRGTARLTVERQTSPAGPLVLDTRDLTIRSVRLGSQNGRLLAFELGANDPVLGRALTIHLPRRLKARFDIVIDYETDPAASGLQWLAPELTAAGTHPFMFSQSQAIHARSWVPLQDTPSVRFTYSATVRTDPELRALMSASNDPAAKLDGEYSFVMEQPIPSYLLAIAVGRFEFAAIGPRTGVYAEPPVLASAAREFEDTEKMLEISEGLFGPYRWGRYDLLILPPSFPFGGMENPRLSFITPTVIAGDKSLVALIAHELAHSWSGNLVTNATWGDLWLNEGFTVFLESRIMQALYGETRREMEDRLGYESLVADLEDLDDEAEVLVRDLDGEDPDAAFSSVPYEKGRFFLVWLDERVGQAAMNEFLEGYFDHFAFRSVTASEFLDYLERELLSRHPGKVTHDEVREWLYAPGLPADAPVPPVDAFESIDATRSAWLDGTLEADDVDTSAWSTQHWLYFLNNLPAELPHERLADLDDAFDLTVARNNEIAHSWLLISVNNGYRPAWPRLERYLGGIGRLKLIKPLYESLLETDDGAAFARRVFNAAKAGYHPLTISTIGGMLDASAGD